MGHKDSTITRKVYARFLNTESTFDPNDLWSKPVIVEQPTAGQQPEAEEIAVMLGLKVQTVYAMARRG